MHAFRWLNEGKPPNALDLRVRGWSLLDARQRDDERIGIACFSRMGTAEWIRFCSVYRHAARKLVILTGVADSGERARMLRMGFGDVTGEIVEIAELEARALKLIELEHMLPRFRQAGRLRLDLLSREAFVDGEAVGLHPREFGLLWRLADAPGKPFSKRRLIEDVWHMRFVPETNSLAVHVSRLRSKLRPFGSDGLLRTTGDGDYMLDLRSEDTAHAPPNPVSEQT
ncbi:MAG: winged helix-turn-helix domain-containing protein [Sphingomonadaceae bacterium]